jgi:hypothetical protein
VWSWRPDAGVKLCETFIERRWLKSPVHRGEREDKPLKPIAQGMPECFGEPVVTNACAFYQRTRGCGCAKHPAFPAPSIVPRVMTGTTRANHAAGVRTFGSSHVAAILRDAARRPLLRKGRTSGAMPTPHGEEHGNAVRLEPRGPDSCLKVGSEVELRKLYCQRARCCRPPTAASARSLPAPAARLARCWSWSRWRRR